MHDDTAAHGVANWLGANAVTVGNDIFFANGRYAPETAEGENLLAHELAHVAQQGGEPRAVQCDLAQSMPVTLGVFDINMITQAGGGGALPGMRGTISFDPDPDGPYSSEIGLIQAINITDVAGATDARTPLLSPLYGDLSGLPPLLVLAGEHEVLLDDALRVIERARQAGCEARALVGRGMQHDYPLTLPWLDESKRAWREMAAFVARCSTAPSAISASAGR